MSDVTWEQAVTKVYSFNTIATLALHVNYYVSAVLKMLQGGPLEAKDAYSSAHPPIQISRRLGKILGKMWADAESFVSLVALLTEHKLWENFTDEKYGNYYRNLHGIVEHSHYHLG